MKVKKARLILLVLGIFILSIGCENKKQKIIAVVKPAESWPRLHPKKCKIVPLVPGIEVDTLRRAEFINNPIGKIVKRTYHNYVVFRAPVSVEEIEEIITACKLTYSDIREHIFWMSAVTHAEVTPVTNLFGDIQFYSVTYNGLSIPESYYTIRHGRLEPKSIQIAGVEAQDGIKLSFYLGLKNNNEPQTFYNRIETSTPVITENLKIKMVPKSGYGIHLSISTTGIVYIERVSNGDQEFLVKWTEDFLPYLIDWYY